MREFLKIALNLVVICLLAAAVLGLVFLKTEEARKRNQALRMERSMARYIEGGVQGVEFRHIYRYLVEGGQAGELGDVAYVAPGQDGPLLLLLTPQGELKAASPLPPEAASADEAERGAALARALPQGSSLDFTDNYILAMRDGQRVASFIQGRTQGFKTWIHMLVALDDSGKVAGLEILEHEEDPGLGGEIETGYFRNQFQGRSPQELAGLEVIRLPLPRQYRQCLERDRWERLGLSAEEGERLCQGSRDAADAGIYAITGATISSTRVLAGVKRLVRAFILRLAAIDAAVAQGNVAVAF